MITPSDGQRRAIEAIKTWYKFSPHPFFYLGGYAGTGKTSIAKIAVEECGLNPEDAREVIYGSYTGKASAVMRSKGLVNARTIHQLVYRIIFTEEGRPIFGFNDESDIQYASLVVLDECSMINEEIAKDLLYFGKKILVLGDPEQLEPTSGTGFFTSGQPHAFLTEVHRQALDNPILRVATDIRQGVPLYKITENSESFRKCNIDKTSRKELDQIFSDADQILTGKNQTRKELNEYLYTRQFPNHKEVRFPLEAGTKMICLKNRHGDMIHNGLLVETTRDTYDHEKRRYKVSFKSLDHNELHWDETECYTVPILAYTNDPEYYHDDGRLKNHVSQYTFGTNYVELDLGYAITVHKAQGSQWNNVLVYDDGFATWRAEDAVTRRRWLYTAITRAVEKVTIVI